MVKKLAVGTATVMATAAAMTILIPLMLFGACTMCAGAIASARDPEPTASQAAFQASSSGRGPEVRLGAVRDYARRGPDGAHNAKAHARRLTKAEFGDAWPFSVDDGVIRCLSNEPGAVVFESGGTIYAVNGIANGLAEQHGFHPIESIWLDDPKFFDMAEELAAADQEPVAQVLEALGKPTKISIGPILDTGVALCR